MTTLLQIYCQVLEHIISRHLAKLWAKISWHRFRLKVANSLWFPHHSVDMAFGGLCTNLVTTVWPSPESCTSPLAFDWSLPVLFAFRSNFVELLVRVRFCRNVCQSANKTQYLCLHLISTRIYIWVTMKQSTTPWCRVCWWMKEKWGQVTG